MSRIIVTQLPRVEGTLRVVTGQDSVDPTVWLESGRSIHIERHLQGRYPLEAVQRTQFLSASSGIAHAVAATIALENYLRLEPTHAGQQLRQVMLQLATIHAHVHHFYWELLPDYLNSRHFSGPGIGLLRYYPGLSTEYSQPGDLPSITGTSILQNVPAAADCLQTLEKALALIGGKYPIAMNLIPGGVTNSSADRHLLMTLVRLLDQIKPFVETIWPGDIRVFVAALPETATVWVGNVNLLSFGSLLTAKSEDPIGQYAGGVMIDGRLEPVNVLKIHESCRYTFHLPLDRTIERNGPTFDFDKPEARTWIRSARYDTEPMLTGALARKLITYFGGGSLEISDHIGQMITDLGLNLETPNSIASRLLAEVFEGRQYLKETLKLLLGFDPDAPLSRKTSFDFGGRGTGIGKVEAPGGALFHQVFISENRIERYRIITSVNWNFSTRDDQGKSGIVERELTRMQETGSLSTAQVCRLLHSYNAQILDGTR
jgi:hydrogenase large subunit